MSPIFPDSPSDCMVFSWFVFFSNAQSDLDDNHHFPDSSGNDFSLGGYIQCFQLAYKIDFISSSGWQALPTPARSHSHGAAGRSLIERDAG